MINEINSLFVFAIIGILIGLLFDVFRVLRKTFKTPNIITYIEDLLFWILTGCLVIYGNIVYEYGEIRLYTILMIIIGVIIYFITISKYFLFINTKLLFFIKKIIYGIVKPFKSLKIRPNFKLIGKNSKFLKFFSKNSGK